MLNDKNVGFEFATKAGIEIFESFMKKDENVLLGRIDENSNPLHPDFLTNMDNYFHFQVDINPVEKFNKLATLLSNLLRDKSRQATRRFKSSQKRFFLKEKEIFAEQTDRNGRRSSWIY